MNNLIYNSVDVIYLENNSNLNKFVSNIDKLNSDYIEVQLSKDFSNISLYKSIYEAIKPLNKGILLNIPESCIVSDLNIKQSDSVMIRYEINKLKLPEILDYCSVNNIRCCLRISYTKDIQDILQWKVKYPSLMIFLRMENIDFNIAYNMLGDNALYLDMPLCIIDKYKINSSLKASNNKTSIELSDINFKTFSLSISSVTKSTSPLVLLYSFIFTYYFLNFFYSI